MTYSKEIKALINKNNKEISVDKVTPFIYDRLISSKSAVNKVIINDWVGYANDEGLIRTCDFGFGSQAKISSVRLQVFKKSNECICCRTAGTHYKKSFTIDNKSFHLNLYSKQSDGTQILMTKDHLVPVSKGGLNSLDNYVTCCSECNMFKGNSDYTWGELRTLLLTKESDELKSLLNSSVNIEHIDRIKNRMECN